MNVCVFSLFVDLNVNDSLKMCFLFCMYFYKYLNYSISSLNVSEENKKLIIKKKNLAISPQCYCSSHYYFGKTKPWQQLSSCVPWKQ